ncbi:uncharacterized protein LOC115890579 [Sitophilus oryzae]|uniref:Uncharacterized protein LOC115890579 n=1 Tax=Sitophilus oryzae TaxID=7048 RepID=A0A6J2YV39_SITOR|nr:uncharacterized protein LOC115890579 [Sitophilus oryzae]
MLLSLLVTLVGFYFVCSENTLPSFLHVCKRDDQHLSECVIKSIEYLRPYLIKGIPEYNIPSLEPLIMENFFSDETQTLKIVVNNVSAYGCSNFTISNLSINLLNHEVIIDVEIPQLMIEAQYTLDGKILLVPVKGTGNLEANITDIGARAKLKGEPYEKDGDIYVRHREIKLKARVGGGSVRLKNLFNDKDKVLLTIINDAINRNLQPFLDQLMPIIENALGRVFLNAGNGIMESFSFNQLFPK